MSYTEITGILWPVDAAYRLTALLFVDARVRGDTMEIEDCVS